MENLQGEPSNMSLKVPKSYQKFKFKTSKCFFYIYPYSKGMSQLSVFFFKLKDVGYVNISNIVYLEVYLPACQPKHISLSAVTATVWPPLLRYSSIGQRGLKFPPPAIREGDKNHGNMLARDNPVPWKQTCVTPHWFQWDLGGYEQAMWNQLLTES